MIFKAACLHIHANFHENFENVSKIKYCDVNIGSNLHKANSADKPRKLPKRSHNIQKYNNPNLSAY
jgi:hypothetical protein